MTETNTALWAKQAPARGETAAPAEEPKPAKKAAKASKKK